MKCGKNLDLLLSLPFFVEGCLFLFFHPPQRQLIYGRGLSQPFSLTGCSFTLQYEIQYNQRLKISGWLSTHWYALCWGTFALPSSSFLEMFASGPAAGRGVAPPWLPTLPGFWLFGFLFYFPSLFLCF